MLFCLCSFRVPFLCLLLVPQAWVIPGCPVAFKSETIPGQVAHLFGALSHLPQGCRFDPQSGCRWEAIDGCLSLTSMFLPLSLPLSLKYPEVRTKRERLRERKPGEISLEKTRVRPSWLRELLCGERIPGTQLGQSPEHPSPHSHRSCPLSWEPMQRNTPL